VRTESDRRIDRYVSIAEATFTVAILVWGVCSIVLAIPHGQGHSIESLRPFEVVRDLAFPVWVSSVAVILTALALRAWRALATR